MSSNSGLKESIYFVQGMHCAGCELRIEKKLRALKCVVSVEASVRRGQVRIKHQGPRPAVGLLNQMFREDGYVFAEEPPEEPHVGPLAPTIIALALIAGFLLLGKTGASELIRIDTTSSLPAFFAFGLAAGASSCAALIGGLVLSMARQWSVNCAMGDSWAAQTRPHLLFNLGRLTSFAFFGGMLGLLGERARPSPALSSALVLLVSLLMIGLGLQMLGVPQLRGLMISLPKPLTRQIADESRFRGRYTPAVVGALTFFLPCGFTLTAQSVALLSSNPLQGALIMFVFALGTLPTLLTIGLSSAFLMSGRRIMNYFLPAAGLLVLFFALYNLNAQLNVLGLPSLSDVNIQALAASPAPSSGRPASPALVGGQQVIRMQASAYGYNPRWVRVKAGVPVRWEITDVGTSGCTNAVISPRLFSGAIALTPGTTSVVEFTPQTPGRYKFSCWMGMVWGVIEVVS